MKKYVIKNDNSYLHYEFGADNIWVENINNATVYDENDIDQNCVPSCVYEIESLVRHGLTKVKLIEVENFYKEKNII
jgi:hypothetical protein